MMKYKYANAIMNMAEEFGKTSESTRLKVGAIIVKHDNPIALGVNGTRAGWHTNVCEDENGNTTNDVIHAEINALNKLRKSNETSSGATLFCTHSPCKSCASELVEAGITRVYYRYQYRLLDGLEYLEKNGVEVIRI